jgi:hypothetical protein
MLSQFGDGNVDRLLVGGERQKPRLGNVEQHRRRRDDRLASSEEHDHRIVRPTARGWQVRGGGQDQHRLARYLDGQHARSNSDDRGFRRRVIDRPGGPAATPGFGIDGRNCRIIRRKSECPVRPRDEFAPVDPFRRGIGIVLGLPLNMDGSEGPRAQSTRAFARNLAKLVDIPIAFWDERLSTSAVTRTLIEADIRRDKRAQVVDKLAASYILQGALDRLRSG